MTGGRKANVQIFSDAGVKGGVAAWAAVIVRLDQRGGIVEASGRLRSSILDGNTEAAEAMAAANGVHKAKLDGLLEPRDRVVVYCDNQAVVARWRAAHCPSPVPERWQRLKNWRPNARIQRAFAVIRAISVELQCVVEFRGVTGHASLSSRDRYAILNARADALCCLELGTKRKGAELVRNGVADLLG